MALEQTSSGAVATVDLLQGLEQVERIVIDGDRIIIPALGVPAGPISLADTSGYDAVLSDEDGDGVADSASGTTRFSAPGFNEEITWALAPRSASTECETGASGDVVVSVEVDGDGVPQVAWEGGNALGLYVTSPGATLPLLPGTFVEDGDAYWVLETNDFPTGFESPVTYGVLPDAADENTVAHGGETGAAQLIPGECYSFSVTTNEFVTGTFTLVY